MATVTVVLAHRCCRSGFREWISVQKHLKEKGVDVTPRSIRYGNNPDGCLAVGVTKEMIKRDGPCIVLPELNLKLLSTDIRDRYTESMGMVDRELEGYAGQH